MARIPADHSNAWEEHQWSRVWPAQVYAILWTDGEHVSESWVEKWNELSTTERMWSAKHDTAMVSVGVARYKGLKNKFPHRTIYESLEIGPPRNPQGRIHR